MSSTENEIFKLKAGRSATKIHYFLSFLIFVTLDLIITYIYSSVSSVSFTLDLTFQVSLVMMLLAGLAYAMKYFQKVQISGVHAFANSQYVDSQQLRVKSSPLLLLLLVGTVATFIFFFFLMNIY